MTKEDLKTILKEKPGYLKCGAPKLSRLFTISKRAAKDAVREVKVELQYPVQNFKRLIFDIETSPNIGWFWGASWKTSIGTHQILEERKVICVSYKWENEDTVYRLHWDDDKDDTELLREFTKVLRTADEVIAHNGDKFDIPWLRTRCLIKKLSFPAYVKSLDTLLKVRNGFNFQSNRLDYIAEIMGLGNKIKIDPEVWKVVCFVPHHTKEYKAGLKEMLEYCDYDVVLLEKVYHGLVRYIKPNTHVGVWAGKKAHSCPQCGAEDVEFVKNNVTIGGIIKRQMSCKTCSSEFLISNSTFLKLKDNGDI